MSFLGKSITNRFPIWSKIKKDESSIGSIIFDIIGERMEESRKTGLNYKEQKRVLEDYPLLTYSNSYKVVLPNYPVDIKQRKIISLSFSDSQGKLSLCDTWSSYNLKLADSFELENKEENYNHLIFEWEVSSKEFQFNDKYDFKKRGKHLLIDCTEINYFYNRNDSYSFGRFIEDDGGEGFEEKYYAIIRGKDYYGKPIEEIIHLNKKNIYKTKNVFYEICPLRNEEEYIKQRVVSGGPSFEVHGIEGTVKIKTESFDNNTFILEDTLSLTDHNSFTNVFGEDSFKENNLKINLNNNKIEYLHSFFKHDYFFHSKDNPLPLNEDEELLVTSRLADLEGSLVEVKNIAYDYRRKRLYGINNKKKLFVWKLERPKFINNRIIENSKETEVNIEIEKNYYELNETFYGRVMLSRPKGPIKEYCLLRTAPSGAIKFLTDDSNWTDEVSFFKGNDRLDSYENIVNFRFEDNSLEEYGQYNYFIISFKESISFATQEEFLNKVKNSIKMDSNNIHCNGTSIIVPKMVAIKEYDLAFLKDVNKESYELAFESYSNKLLIKQNDEVYHLNEVSRKYYFNWLRGVIYTQEKYENAVFSIQFDNNVTYECEINYE